MDKQHIRAGTTTALANFTVPWALLSWLTSSLVAVTRFLQVTVTQYGPTHREGSKTQRYPQLGHCDLVWPLFIPVLHFCNRVILDFLSNELVYWVTSVITMRGGKYLSSNSASWKPRHSSQRFPLALKLQQLEEKHYTSVTYWKQRLYLLFINAHLRTFQSITSAQEKKKIGNTWWFSYSESTPILKKKKKVAREKLFHIDSLQFWRVQVWKSHENNCFTYMLKCL